MSVADGPPQQNLFAELDTDADGKLTKEEVLQHFKKGGRDELPPGLWEGEDKDADGFISWEEVATSARTQDLSLPSIHC